MSEATPEETPGGELEANPPSEGDLTPGSDDEAEAEEEGEPTTPDGEPPPEPEPEPEPDPEPEQPQGASKEEWDKFYDKANGRFETYQKWVHENYPGDTHLLAAFVFSPHAPYGFLSTEDAGRLDEAESRALLEWLGFAREQDYEPDPETETCPACGGKGKTKTGSTVGGHETRPCPRCKGWGYTVAGRTPSPVPVEANGEGDAASVPVAPSSSTDMDNWGEPRILPDGRENPNFGKQPQYKVEVQPWGITAGLTAQDAPVEA